MPTYGYLCDPENDGCGHQFEVFQSITASPKRKCPECKKRKLRRLFGSPTFIFKGAGFYCNDYRKPTKKDCKELAKDYNQKMAETTDGKKVEPKAEAKKEDK